MRTFFSYAFRPFFLCNAIFGILAMLVWAMVLHGFTPTFLPADVTSWHAHEMLVGFAMATIAGFILTAVATWTGRPALQGGLLGLLVLAWLAGRLAMGFAGALQPVWVLGIDMLFPLLLVLLVAREVIAGGSQRNYPIIFITVLLAAFNFLFHASAVGYVPLAVNADRIAVYLLIHLVLLLITVIAGRIIPSFTANWLRSRGQQHLPRTSALIDRMTLLVTIVTGLYAAVAPLSLLTGVLAFAAALLHLIRLSRWCGMATRSEPLLFVMHVAYLWLPVGYALTGLAVFGWWITPAVAVHALTVGGIGMMIMAVTTRVSLAHTGRKLQAARLTVVAYWVLSLAVVLRLVSPFGSNYLTILDLSIVSWVLAFVIFIWVYAPILIAPKVDE
jgi:uncharacterized protein involved in response to NO